MGIIKRIRKNAEAIIKGIIIWLIASSFIYRIYVLVKPMDKGIQDTVTLLICLILILNVNWY